ncbi:MAG: hypothetical protein H0U33_05120 [Solirubrobacterales bacterium]|nr:hypothetical protein [Solirubrobacterales bacterium]
MADLRYIDEALGLQLAIGCHRGVSVCADLKGGFSDAEKHLPVGFRAGSALQCDVEQPGVWAEGVPRRTVERLVQERNELRQLLAFRLGHRPLPAS